MRWALTRERTTWLVSAVAAIAIIGAVVTAQPSRTAPRSALSRLESDLRYQLELGAAHDRAASERRVAELDSVLAAWRQSPRLEGDNKLMAAWLKSAIAATMPGESGKLPTAPVFGGEDVHAAVDASRSEAHGRSHESGVRTHESRAASAPARDERGISAPSENRMIAVESAPPEEVIVVEATTPTGELREAPVIDSWPPAATAESETVAIDARSGKAVVASASGPASSTTPAPAAERVRVNLGELNARVRGYHDGLTEIESAVVAKGDDATLGDVARWVGELEALSLQRDFVMLYFATLSPAERRAVTTPREMTPTIRLVEQRWASVESEEDNDFLAPGVGEQVDLVRRLEALAARDR